MEERGEAGLCLYEPQRPAQDPPGTRPFRRSATPGPMKRPLAAAPFLGEATSGAGIAPPEGDC